MPSGSSRQLGLLQQHHVLHATLGQVVGDAGADASSADDDRVRRVLPPLPQGRGCIAGAQTVRRKGNLATKKKQMRHAPVRE